MKLQVGLLYRDSRQAQRADLNTILGEFGQGNWETGGEVLDGPLAMAYRGHGITVEEDNEVQPLKYGPYILTFDGRLDNRSDILLRLGIHQDRGIPDPTIILEAYEKFGDSILPTLIGEFALTIWCSRTQSLSFARSLCGARPLYYVYDGRRLIWSSDFAHLVRISRVDLQVNEQAIFECLIARPNATHTPLSQVSVVPRNSMFRFRDGEWRSLISLWSPYDVQPLDYRSDAEYEEQCLQKITEAVQVRLRSKWPIFFEMSGGLDSSSVILIADRIRSSLNNPSANLHTVSYVYELSRNADEDYFIRQVESARGVTTDRICEEDHVTLGLRDIRFTGLPTPFHCFPGRYSAVTQSMQQRQARVLFSGNGGDHLFWSATDAPALMADEMRKGKLIKTHKLCCVWSRLDRTPYFNLWGQATRLAFPGIFPQHKETMPSWISAKCSEWIQDTSENDEHRGNPTFRAHLAMIDGLFTQLSMGYRADYPNISFTYPYAHRPLVEFCLATPASQFLRNGETRSLMRRTMIDILPTTIVHRKSKGFLEEVFCRALQRDWETVGDLRQWEICQRGFADPDEFSRDLNLMRLGVHIPYGNFVFACATERWLRSLSRIHEVDASPETAEQPGYAASV